MFEVIHSSATTANRALPTWVGQRLRGNVLALAERGPGGGYTWSRESGGDVVELTVTPTGSLPSPVSTHPDYWYSVPFLVVPSPYQTEVRIIVRGTVTGAGVQVRLWCEGAVSAVSPAWTSGTSRTMTVDIPRRAPGTDVRCALLVRSRRGDEVDDGPLAEVSPRYLRTSTAVVSGGTDRRAAHYLVELSSTGTASEGYGLQGETRYHSIRAHHDGSHDEWEVWPRPDRSLEVSGATTGITATVYELGTLTLASIQVATVTGQVRGIAADSATYPTKLVFAEWLTRMARYARGLLLQPQYAWIGGVAGVERSTGTLSIAQAPIPYRLWGAQLRLDTSPVVVLRTALRARDGVAGVAVSLLYSSASAVSVVVDFDEGAADATVVELGASPRSAVDRDRIGDPGTLHWRHMPLTRDQCSSQDLGLHGAELEGYDCDTARLTPVRLLVPWPEGYTPTPGELVRIQVSASTRGEAYIAAQTVLELLTDGFVPQMANPVIAPVREILAPSWDALRQRLNAGYARLVRCVYSEWGDPLGTYTPLSSGAASTVAVTEYRTSPDLPAGTVLRMTCDAEAASGGTLTVSFLDGVSTVTTAHGARSVLTADLAAASDTVYTLGITALVTGSGSVGRIYLLRIEEVTP